MSELAEELVAARRRAEEAEARVEQLVEQCSELEALAPMVDLRTAERDEIRDVALALLRGAETSTATTVAFPLNLVTALHDQVTNPLATPLTDRIQAAEGEIKELQHLLATITWAVMNWDGPSETINHTDIPGLVQAAIIERDLLRKVADAADNVLDEDRESWSPEHAALADALLAVDEPRRVTGEHVWQLFTARLDGLRYRPPGCPNCGQSHELVRRFNSGDPIVHYEAPCNCYDDALTPRQIETIVAIGGEYKHALDHVATCGGTCQDCQRLARSALAHENLDDFRVE